MALSAFDDKAREPRDGELDEALGDAAALWQELVATLQVELAPLAADWTFSGKPWGWALRLRHRKRAVLYLTPSHGFFYAGFALGGKAVAAARESDLPRAVVELIDSAQRYAEGRAVRLEVKDRRDLQSALEIARLKMAH